MIRQEARDQITETIGFIKTLYSVAEMKIIAVGAVLGGYAAAALGGFDKQLIALFWLSVIDFATGFYAACHCGNCWSAKMFRGFMKKLSIFGAVAVAVLLDHVFTSSVFRYAAIAGFGLMEALSIVENADRGGWGDFIPDWVRNYLALLKKQRLDKYQDGPTPEQLAAQSAGKKGDPQA